MLSWAGFRDEWRLQSRNPLIWIALAIVAGFSLVIADGSPSDPGASAEAALLRINLFIPAFILPFLAGALSPLFFLRETDHGMAELFGAYPLTVRQWLATRLGSFTALLTGASMIAQLGFVLVLADDHPRELVRMIGHSALWLVVLHLPSCLIWGCGMAWLASRTASSGFLYAAAGLGWMAYLALASVIGLPLIAGSDVAFPKLWQAMLVLDPYGATAMISAAPESGVLQWRAANVTLGRIGWLVICLLLLRQIRTLPSEASRLFKRREPPEHRDLAVAKPRSRWLDRVAHSHLAIHARYFVRDRIFVLMIGGWIALLLPEAYAGSDYAEALSRVLPDSRDALNRVMWDVVPLAGALLQLYAADRVCRMYQSSRMHELYAATPHRAARLVAVQVGTLWGISLVFMALAGLSIVVAQLLAGTAIQPTEYLRQLGLALPVWLLLGLLLVAVHGIIPTRFVANLVGLLVVTLGLTSLAPSLGLEHPLWRPLFTPLGEPDHYWGFSGSLASHAIYLLFWLPVILATLLTAIAWHHRTQPSGQITLRQALRSPATLLAMPLLGLAGWQGMAIDGMLRAEGLLLASDEQARQRAEYERHYAVWAARPQPDVARISAVVDFRVRKNRVGLHARIRLVNRTAQPIGEVLVGRNRLDPGGTIALQGASMLNHDAALGQTVYRLSRPLAPGAAIELDFRTEIAQSGVAPAAFPLVLRPSFSSVPVHAIVPVIGFKRQLTLRDPAARSEQSLPELRLTPPSRLPLQPAGSLAGSLVELDTIVSVDADHHAIAQGDLVRRWQSAGRSYFHYRTPGPMRNLSILYALPLKPQVWSAGAVRIETFSPENLSATDPNVLAMRDTLGWLGREVAPYPANALRLVAIPDVGPSGYAYPGVIEISHRLGFRARPETGAAFSQVYRRAAHETAHQWFGHLLGHGIPDENAFLVESLAKYAELVVIERRYGEEARRALVRFERDRYRREVLDEGREVMPLIDAEAPEDMYSRATLVFACVREKLGDRQITAVLRAMAARSRATLTPARSVEFVEALTASARPDLRKPLAGLFVGRASLDRQLSSIGCATD